MKFPLDIPDDEYAEVSGFDDLEPRYLLARSGRDQAIARAKELYVDGSVTADELEAEIDRILEATGS